MYLWMYKYNDEYFDNIGFHFFENELQVEINVKKVIKKTLSSMNGKMKVDEVHVELKLERSNEETIPKALYGENILGMTAVIGKNGAGKTALLRSIMQSDNTQSDLSAKRWPFIAIYYDEDKEEILIDKHQVEVEKIENAMNVVLARESSTFIMKKCYVTNVFNRKRLEQTGEEVLMNFRTNLNDSVKKINQEAEVLGQKIDILLLLDEIDCHLHPIWQQQVMKYVLDWLQELYQHCRFQLVISTHSPIILSDFMRQQVIKLKSENGKCVVQQDEQETFGANIAHLYYDSFFMENGQIGEVSKNKILEAIECIHNPNFYQNPDYLRDFKKAKYIISHIGDEFMRRKLIAKCNLRIQELNEVKN